MGMSDAFDQLFCRVAGFERNVHDPASQGFQIALMEAELTLGPGTALDENVRRKTQEKRVRRWPVERNHKVHRRERRDDFHSFRDWGHRAQRFSVAILLARARVILHGDHQEVAIRARLLEKANMPGVQQVERAARAHHSPAVAFPFAPAENRFALRDDLSQSIASSRCDRKTRRLNSITHA